MYLLLGAQRTESEQERFEWRFFNRVRLRNGVYKTTASRQLTGLNDLVGRLLPSARPLELMDVAVSSGLSTLEWALQLESMGVAYRLVGGDASLRVTLVSLGAMLAAIADRNGYPLHFDIFGFGLQGSSDRVPLSWVTSTLRMAFSVFLKLRPSVRQAVANPTAPGLRTPWITCRPITLVSPRLLALTSLELVEDDITANRDLALKHRFHAVRAANILNRGYFDEPTLRTILDNPRFRLRPGGLLIVSRTEPSRDNHGTIFKLGVRGSFEVLERLGRGPEIEEPVLALRGTGERWFAWPCATEDDLRVKTRGKHRLSKESP